MLCYQCIKDIESNGVNEMTKFTAYIRPQGQSTPLIEMVSADYIEECKTMAVKTVERLALNGALPTGAGFFHIREKTTRAIVYESELISAPK